MGAVFLMKSIRVSFILFILPFISFGQVKLEDYLASATYAKWDSIKCKEFYNIAEYEIGYLDKAPEIKSMDRMYANKVYPDVPDAFRVNGKVIFRFVLTKNNEIECLKIYSALPKAYVDAAVIAFKELEFEPAASNGEKIDFRMVLPITFSEKEYNQRIKALRKRKR